MNQSSLTPLILTPLISLKIDNPAEAIKKIVQKYKPDALLVDETDGISFEFDNWRFNLRSSNTEPVARLNVESRANKQLMVEMTQQLCSLLSS